MITPEQTAWLEAAPDGASRSIEMAQHGLRIKFTSERLPASDGTTRQDSSAAFEVCRLLVAVNDGSEPHTVDDERDLDDDHAHDRILRKAYAVLEGGAPVSDLVSKLVTVAGKPGDELDDDHTSDAHALVQVRKLLAECGGPPSDAADELNASEHKRLMDSLFESRAKLDALIRSVEARASDLDNLAALIRMSRPPVPTMSAPSIIDLIKLNAKSIRADLDAAKEKT